MVTFAHVWWKTTPGAISSTAPLGRHASRADACPCQYRSAISSTSPMPLLIFGAQARPRASQARPRASQVRPPGRTPSRRV
jgi:hypothetical protein